MAHQFIIPGPALRSAPVRLVRPQVVIQAVRNALRGLADPYRPERHYMRGPGPKWRAKHLGAPQSR
jgi:hypothetical protein